MDPTQYPTKVKAIWETASRLLVTVVNEGLVKICYVPAETDNGLQIKIEARDELEEKTQHFVLVKARKRIGYDENSSKPVLPLSPQDLQMPVVMVNTKTHTCDQLVLSDPGTLFNMMFPWLGLDIACKSQIIMELNSSARFQGRGLIPIRSLAKTD